MRTDGSPPLYFLLVQAVTGVFGSSEIALRLVSIAAATALVPACYAVARVFATRRTALVAAALAVVSPLVHFYAIEARNYALVQLETVAIVYVALRALAAADRWRWWILLALAETIQLWTHGHAVFVVGATPLVFLLVASRDRIRVAMYAAAASALAVVLALPALIGAWRYSAVGVADWIVGYWKQTPPAAAVLRSLEVFGFGGLYPSYLSWLGQVPSIRPLSVALTALLMIAAVAPMAMRTRRRSARAVATNALLAFLLLPLLAAWLYSSLRQPVYFVGRYDTIVLPAFLILAAMGLDELLRLRWWIGASACVTVLALSSLSFVVVERIAVFPNEEDRRAAEHIAREAQPSDPIVTTGLRRAVFAYYLDRAAHSSALTSFPPEVAEHPGWYSAERMLTDRASLAQDGERVAADLISRARQGSRVWILASGPNEVDAYLYRTLLTALVLDRPASREDLQVLCLKHP